MEFLQIINFIGNFCKGANLIRKDEKIEVETLIDEKRGCINRVIIQIVIGKLNERQIYKLSIFST